ncbi:MAG: hypothetical protein AB1921_04705 [Thermodesulfobacteriota bacterium]
MERSWVRVAILLAALCIFAAPYWLHADQDMQKTDCAKYSDDFDKLDRDRWYPALGYSEHHGKAFCDKGGLILQTPSDEPCEIQVYSLFTLEGDFDISVGYEILAGTEGPSCRMNTGLVLTADGNEDISYKALVGVTPPGKTVYRARLDRLGIQMVEKKKFKEFPAPAAGRIRVVRKDGRITYFATEDGKEQTVYEFEQPCDSKLRVRIKLTTGSSEAMQDACISAVSFSDFTVASCQGVTPG